MRDRPTGDELLTCARKLVRDEVMPSLPADRKHTVLMVMNAMSIAERQLRYGEAPAHRELAAIKSLVGGDCSDLAAGNRRLCILIRAGRADPGQIQRAAVFSYLRASGRQRLLESNPKILDDGNP
jgi:Domain of unknown function (DUF6285)